MVGHLMKTIKHANDFDDVEKVLTDFETKYGDRVRYRLSISEGE